MTLLIENINKYASSKFMTALNFVKIINIPHVARKKAMDGIPLDPIRSLEG